MPVGLYRLVQHLNFFAFILSMFFFLPTIFKGSPNFTPESAFWSGLEKTFKPPPGIRGQAPCRLMTFKPLIPPDPYQQVSPHLSQPRSLWKPHPCPRPQARGSEGQDPRETEVAGSHQPSWQNPDGSHSLTLRYLSTFSQRTAFL